MSLRRLSFRHWLLHGTRIAIVATILLLIRWQHIQSIAQTSVSAPTRQQLEPFFPGTLKIGSHGDDTFVITDDNGTLLGSVLQTSPRSDHIKGFSGPSNVLIALDPDERVLGIHVISSGDTRDHVKHVLADDAFMSSLNGLSRQEVTGSNKFDAVSGATLTSSAIREAIRYRLGGSAVTLSLRFPGPLSVEDVAVLFPAARSVSRRRNQGSRWQVTDAAGNTIGTVLRTAPVADNLVGYQGPTDTLIACEPNSRIIGIVVNKSYDNEPYVGYVKDDVHFRTFFDGRLLNDLASLDLDSGEIEGVSGATMTSKAVVEGMVLAAREQQKQSLRAARAKANPVKLTSHDIGTVAVVLFGVLVGLTSLRSNRRIRVCFQIVLVVYLGLTAGNLVSQAQLLGWARHGTPWRTTLGLTTLSLAAFAIPITTRRNLYCTHLCPHGALQQLARNRVTRKSFRMRSSAKRFLAMIPGMILAWCIIVTMTTISFSLVDIEPFDAYVFRIAGWATIAVAVIGLVASMFIPMAYCQYGCPTGAMLNFLRFNSASDRWLTRDWVAVALLCLAALLCRS